MYKITQRTKKATYLSLQVSICEMIANKKLRKWKTSKALPQQAKTFHYSHCFLRVTIVTKAVLIRPMFGTKDWKFFDQDHVAPMYYVTRRLVLERSYLIRSFLSGTEKSSCLWEAYCPRYQESHCVLKDECDCIILEFVNTVVSLSFEYFIAKVVSLNF